MKVMMAMDSYLPSVDGVVNCMHNYMTNIQNEEDCEAFAVVPKAKDADDGKLPYEVIRCKSFLIPVFNQYYGTPNDDRALTAKLMKREIDIIHLHSPFNMSKYALKIAKKKNIPIVATFHTNFRPIFQNVFKSDVIAEQVVRSLDKVYNKFDEVFVCSPEVEEQARSFGYVGKITYLPFGTNMEKPNNLEELKKAANAKFGLKEDELVFIYVGRIMKLKRIDFILDALKILKDKNIAFKFLVVGKGIDEQYIHKYAQRLEVQDNVIFTGFLSEEDVRSAYSRADLLLFPSLYDNFGLVKVEGAGFQTPGVFIENSCAGYGIADGHNGYLSKDTVQDFASKIESIISDRAKLRETGVNAMNELYFSWADATKVLVKNYDRIIAEKKSAQGENV